MQAVEELSVPHWGIEKCDMSAVGDNSIASLTVGFSFLGDENADMKGEAVGWGDGHGELSALAPPWMVGRVTCRVSFSEAPMLWPMDEPQGFQRVSGLGSFSSSWLLDVGESEDAPGLLSLSDSGDLLLLLLAARSRVSAFCSSTTGIVNRCRYALRMLK